MPLELSPEIAYFLLLLGLFVVPRVIQRFGVPTAITAFALGALSSLGFSLFVKDTTVSLLSTLGIVSLFLFAGLEVDLESLRREGKIIIQHLLVRVFMLGTVAVALYYALDLEVRVATLVGLALVTPSTGFILDSLDQLKVTPRERFWIRSKAIATELLALGVLFVVLRSSTALDLGISSIALVGLIAVLPLMFRVFARYVEPHAPKSDFAFLVIVAVMCAMITRRLGVYYLVGAFITGMAAQRFRDRLPSMSSEKMLHAVGAFASLFVPFYFFHAGLKLDQSDFSLASVGVGLLFLVVVVPFRLAATALHRRLALGESFRASLRVSVPMLPTLVFTLVLAEIVRERFTPPGYLYGALIVYTVVNTLLPSLLRQAPPPEFDTPEVPPPSEPGTADPKPSGEAPPSGDLTPST